MSAFAAIRGQRPPEPASESGNALFTPTYRLPSDEVRTNFVPGENLVFEENSVVVTLAPHENILINGQCTLMVERGTAVVNGIHLTQLSHTIVAPAAQALPSVSAMSSSHPTRVRLTNHFTGLEKVGDYYAPFRSYFHNPDSFYDQPDKQYVKTARRFGTYLFEIAFLPSLVGINVPQEWGEHITNYAKSPGVFVVIGKKNSGKSTFSRTLLNQIVLEAGVCEYLDIDPGQSEFSNPYTLSLTKVTEPVFGMNVPSSACSDPNKTSHYYGFLSPQHQPRQYIQIIKELYAKHSPHHSLVVNTAGWIKGYGKELLEEITAFIHPDHLVFLTYDDEEDISDNSDVTDLLTYTHCDTLPGINRSSRYSPVQLRMFHKMRYFHEKEQRYDFASHLLGQAPVTLAYQNVLDDTFIGVNAVCVLGYDTADFHMDDVWLMVEASIVGLYLVHEDDYTELEHAAHLPRTAAHPFYLDLSAFAKASYAKLLFGGLAMVHLVDCPTNTLRLYLPSPNQDFIKFHLQHNHKLIVVKGEGDIPVCELTHPAFKSVPYLNDAGSKIGGVWRARRNVMRKNHQR